MVISGGNVSGNQTITKESRRPFMADKEGTMVIRAWVEPAQNNSLRARLISSRPGNDREMEEAAGNADDILLAVRRWLDLLQQDEDSTKV
jgi:hypothetical protein